MIEPPIGLLAELTHRCPLRCPYCSNPLTLAAQREEMTTAQWARVFGEAAEMGVLHVHLSGGEPAARRDLAELVAHAVAGGLYTNLITSGVMLDAARLATLVEAGLDHVQLSVQDSERSSADRIAGFPGGQDRKMAFAAEVRAVGLPLTLNAVVHRQNLDRLDEMIALALKLGAARLEVAHVQYYGWALANRDHLLPTRGQLERATEMVEQARIDFTGRLAIDYVVPDYYASEPKPCMGGWGRHVLVVNPTGRVLPCHAAESLPDLVFDTVHDRSLAEIWNHSQAFERYRGTSWMRGPCVGCANAEKDWGGCRCQAYALTGRADATDPACKLSHDHSLLDVAIRQSAVPMGAFLYREMGGRHTELPAMPNLGSGVGRTS
jgi:pyrroloquinoline quinone biosynthesis protein E